MNADRIRARRSQFIRRGCIVVWLLVVLIGIAALIPFLRNYQRPEAAQGGAFKSEEVVSIPAIETPTSTALPPSPTSEELIPPPAPSPTQCLLPAGWVPYVLTPGDNINNIAREIGLTVQELQHANCGADLINAPSGAAIFLPYIPTLTPTLTPSSTSTVISIIIIDTDTPTPTVTRPPATATRYIPPTATKKPPKDNPPPSRPTSTPSDSRP